MRSVAVRTARRWVSDRAELHSGWRSSAPLDLAQVISPLRLDVLVRASLFVRWAEDWSRLRGRPDLALDIAREHQYRQWFDLIAVSKVTGRAEPERGVEEAFAWRVERSHKLLAAFIKDGFDERRPVTIRLHRGGPIETGKVMGPRAYPVNGCHRLALLWASGVRTVAPSVYRLLPDESAPRDNTSSLLSGMSMNDADYFRYIGWGYGMPNASSLADLNTAVPLGDPRRAELASVLAADRGLDLGSLTSSTSGDSPS